MSERVTQVMIMRTPARKRKREGGREGRNDGEDDGKANNGNMDRRVDMPDVMKQLNSGTNRSFEEEEGLEPGNFSEVDEACNFSRIDGAGEGEPKVKG